MMRTTIAAVSAAALLALAGCSSDSGSADSDHNKADVTFAQQMIPHHQQAVEMADLAATRAEDPAVKKVASEIKAAQGPEIATMTGWLESWGEDAAPSGMGDMEGMDHGGSGSMQGMMSQAQMSELAASTGAAFDRAFLTMMVAHHEGAVVMAKTERADGENADAKELAGAIIEAQTREIATMKDLLGS